jgi:hypothetical protein
MNGQRSKVEANLEVRSRGRGVDRFGASGRQGNDLETFGPFPAKLAPPKSNFTNALSGVKTTATIRTVPSLTLATQTWCTGIMSFNGPLDENFPTPAAADKSTVSHVQKGFKISARKLPISKSEPIDEMSNKLGIPIPEMIFGDNMVSIEHLATGWRLEFNAYDALDRVDKTDKNMLKVAYSKEWSSSRYKSNPV